MKLKFSLFLILFLLLAFINPLKAEVWLPITGNSGNSAEVEIDTIDINEDIATFKVRNFDDNYTYITKMKIDLKNKTAGLLNRTAYSANKQVSFKDNSASFNYSQIKDGTLAQAVYDMLTVAQASPALDVKMKIWQKYFKKQQRIVQSKWHPNKFWGMEPSERAISYVVLVVDKDGNILSKNYQNATRLRNEKNADLYTNFFNKLQEEIENIFVKVPKFEPLPKEYKGDKVILVMKFEYSFRHDAKVKSISWEDTGIGYLEYGKNHNGWVYFGKVIYSIAAFPIAIPCCLFGVNIYSWL